MRVEIIVFGAIFVFVVVASIFLSVPQQTSELQNLGSAPELSDIQGWINSDPLTIGQLKGKVVLVDFWTYSCINCIRTLPYLESWYDKYHDKGLVVIGVHTPEFEFEKSYSNVKTAVEKYGIKYAVAQDNNYATWNAFGNKYWPRKYLIDKDGNIRYDHIGEGGYEETETAIRYLLQEARPFLLENAADISQDTNFSEIGTPEIYLGYSFARSPLGNIEGFSPGKIVNYTVSNITSPNTIYLSGSWKNEADRIVAVDNAKLFLVYKAKNVNIVAGGNSTTNVFVDGEIAGGDDVLNGIANINSYRLYNVVFGINYDVHLLEIGASHGFELYTVTFG